MKQFFTTGGNSIRMMASSPVVVPLQPPPVRPKPQAVPGSYGWPVIGPLSDRLNYSWFQGPENFFKKKIEKHNSTVFRTNVPPSFPFFFGVNPNVIAVLDVKSFSHLFDMDNIEKTDVLVGDFMPSVKFTGGMRMCAYLDTSEPKHAQIKNFMLDILKRSSTIWASSVVTSLDTMFNTIETTISTSSDNSASYFVPVQQFLLTFLSRCLLGADPSTTPEIEKSGVNMIDRWLALQLLPSVPINVLQPLAEIFLHSFTYPFWLVKSDYEKLSNFVKTQAKEAVQRAKTDFKLTEDEAIHNLIFTLGFNAFGGFSVFIPQLLSNLGDQKSVHDELRKEVRQILAKNNNVLSFQAVKQMELVNSFVYETLRTSPPVPSQFGRARKDFELASHDAVFEIKKGELLCGYQPVAMRDSKIFENPEDFVYDRFTKEKGGDELLKYLFWSNGPQSGAHGPSASNKQCAARDTVPMTAALLLAYIFQRYDDITLSSGSVTNYRKTN